MAPFTSLFHTPEHFLQVKSPWTKLDNPDALSEHIGLLNRTITSQFIDRYKNNIVHSSFYDNTKLHTNDYIINEPIETYEYTSSGIGGIEGAPNKSHFKIIMKK